MSDYPIQEWACPWDDDWQEDVADRDTFETEQIRRIVVWGFIVWSLVFWAVMLSGMAVVWWLSSP